MNMTLRQTLYLSFMAHLVIFGCTIAVARLSGDLSIASPGIIPVTLFASAPEAGRAPAQRPAIMEEQQQALNEVSVPDRPAVASEAIAHDDAQTTSIASVPVHDADTAGGVSLVSGQVRESASSGGSTGEGTGSISAEQWRLIESALERTKTYPRVARERGIEGVVRLRFRVNESGSVEKIVIVESSGSELLDSASIRAVHRAAPMPSVQGWVDVPMVYVLK
jgi:TonB family protein